jgi:iron complex transport system substrate-binding protein
MSSRFPRRTGVLCILCLCLCLAALPAAAKVVTDQHGTEVTIPDHVSRSVVLMHHAIDIAIQLGAQDQIAGVMGQWEKNLPGADKYMPQLKTLPTPGELASVNMEALLAVKPDVVVMTHYAPKEMRQQIEAAGIPVVSVSLYEAEYEQASRLNPKLKDPDEAYTRGMKAGILLLGEVYGKQERAKELVAAIEKNRGIVAKHLGSVADDKRVTCYMANPDLNTYGTGKYTGVVMDRAGGRNVAAEIDGYQKVSMEDILRWNPQVIFVQDRYQAIIPEIMSDPAWAKIKAVKDKRVYLTPEFVKPWGHPTPESMALGEIWMAKKLYPDRFADVDMPALVNAYYTTFYGQPYSGEY